MPGTALLSRQAALLLLLAVAVSCGEGGGSPVEPPPAAVSVGVSPDSVSLEEGAAAQLTTRVAGSSETRVRWSSEDPLVATVDSTGRVLGRSAGLATVTATSLADANARGAARVRVVPAAVAAVRVSPLAATLTVEQSTQLAATLSDTRGAELAGREVAWSSADSSVAEVNGTGLVTAKRPGTVRITATSQGVSGSADVTVVDVVSNLGFTYAGDRSGMYSVTGDVTLDSSRRPQFGSWAAALPQDAANVQIAAARAGTGRLADIFLVVLHNVSAPGTYSLSESCTGTTATSCARGLVAFGYNWDSRTPPPEAQYDLLSGTITVTSLGADRLRGTFQVSGPRIPASAGSPLSLADGRFDVAVVRDTQPLSRILLPRGFSLPRR